ncbi:capsid protein [Chimpanzee stool avian-like circovirus Chimp17]|uniref:Capsid protein n=1 Tax=Chimpanzee stool avian-like circovirus Chimp17 TaxID=743290 RepID=D4N3Q1_9CIRC|nr:capsid protein [Chimpanzee stool avian-like circovirus Chimp17]ADD62466.1 capsid protein [Chimpanzee stool avian-like circovirus Chimp17]
MNRIYLFRLRHSVKVTLQRDESGAFKYGTDAFTFTLEDVLKRDGGQLKLPFEDYTIVLVKVEMRPLGESVTIWKGFGHTVPIQDARLTNFKKKAGLQDDPLANFDGAKKWDQRWGFKRLLRPRPQLVSTDLSTANEVAPIWLNSQRSFWIPLQQTAQRIAPEKINHYGLAFSYLQPSPEDEFYQAEITFYMKFRQFAWTTLNDPPTPNWQEQLPPNMELMNIIDEDEGVDFQ